ncbi:MAG: NF038122 family metalloprotease [Leptolyngbyaceae bacterium]|nr:NF038122 family metalloprotease [Leptolyngbyaceae bacterium]
MIAFETAGYIWSQYLTDDIEVNVHIGISSDLPENVIGGALPGIAADQSYTTFQQSLANDTVLSANDQKAIANLPEELFGYYAFLSGGNMVASNKLDLTRANAKAINLVPGQNSNLDGLILMSDLSNLVINSVAVNQDDNPDNDIVWDYRQTANPLNNSLDLLGVALHELGHILGFVSGVDTRNINIDSTEQAWQETTLLYGDPNTLDSGTSGSSAPPVPGAAAADNRVMALDMFRYSSNSSNWVSNFMHRVATFVVGNRLIDLSTGGDPYFSLNKGIDNLANFSSGEYGDGYQASHWQQQDPSLGIMNPTLSLEMRNDISALDLVAFDALGLDISGNGINTNITLQTLEQQAKQHLANELGKTVSWLEANPDEAIALLSQDRTDDVEQMIDDSVIYAGKKKNGGSDGSWLEFWQQIQDILAQEGSFASLDINPSSTSPDDKVFSLDRGLYSTESKRKWGGEDGAWNIGQSPIDGLSQDLVSNHSVWAPKVMKGGKANDDLSGSSAQDWLSGGQGNDHIRGKKGDDLLRGGNHRDVLRGGAGADIFVVQDKHGFDVVRDFTDGEDRLKLSGQLSLGQLTFTQKGDHTLIEKDNSLLMVLRNVTVEAVTSADFV